MKLVQPLIDDIQDGSHFGVTQYEYDANDNCIYKGCNTDILASDDHTDWIITKYTYDADSNCTKKQVRVTTWTDRASGWS